MRFFLSWSALLLFGLVAGGVMAAGMSSRPETPETAASMTDVHLWWYMGRAGGFVAYWLLFGSLALGLAVSSRFFDGLLARPWVYEMHQFLSLVVLLAMLFHALVLLPDPYAHFRLQDLFVPLASDYRPEALSVGIVTLYGSVFVSASFYLKRYIGQKGWRVLHYATFALFLGAMLHGIFAGTDTRQAWVQYMYLASGLAVLFLSFFRILASNRAARKAAGAAPVRGAAVASKVRSSPPATMASPPLLSGD
jgi:predicted ferric reductase